MSFLVCLGSKSGQFWGLEMDPFCTYQMWPLFISGQIYLLLRGQNQEPFGYQICTNFLGPDTNLFWVPDLEQYLIIFVQFWAPDLEPFLATRNGNQIWHQKLDPKIDPKSGSKTRPKNRPQNWIPNLDSKPARQQAGRTASEPASQTKQTASRTDSQQASQATN